MKKKCTIKDHGLIVGEVVKIPVNYLYTTYSPSTEESGAAFTASEHIVTEVNGDEITYELKGDK